MKLQYNKHPKKIGEKMKKNIIFCALIALMISGCGIASSTKSGAVGADRSQVMLVSAEQMQAGAKQSYDKVLADAKKKGVLNKNKAQTKRVKAIANRIIPQVGVFRSDALKWNWEVNVIAQDTLNAWCMPGGKIAFYSGIIEKLKLTDDEIAAIMGHEISHALKEHGRERASQEKIKNIGIAAAGALAGVSNENLVWANLAAKYVIELPFSRSHETEADNMGIELAARAGYNPDAAVNVWKKMQKISKNQPMELLSTHPSHESRIENLTSMSKKVYPLYKKAKK